MPSRLATLGWSVRSGRSMVLATAITTRLLPGRLGQWNRLYITSCRDVTNRSSSSISTTVGCPRAPAPAVKCADSLVSAPRGCSRFPPPSAAQSSVYAWLAPASFMPLISRYEKRGSLRRSMRSCSARIAARTVAVLPVPGTPQMYAQLPVPAWTASAVQSSTCWYSALRHGSDVGVEPTWSSSLARSCSVGAGAAAAGDCGVAALGSAGGCAGCGAPRRARFAGGER